jgi:hypothetical protein
MPASMTFNSLLSLIRGYLERGNVSDTTVYNSLPTLINQAERAIANKLKIQGQISNVTALLQGGLPVYQKPDRWRQTISMNYGAGAINDLSTLSQLPITTISLVNLVVAPTTLGSKRYPLFPRSLEYCQTYWPDASQTGTPKFYADYDYYHWLVVPTPDTAYPWAINYYQLLPLLDNSNQTNWLTDIQPNMLLYRALLECTPFLKNDERIPVWEKLYTDEIGSVSTQDLQKAVDRSAVRNAA